MISWIQYLPFFKGIFEVLLVGLAVMTTLFCVMTIRNLIGYSHLIMSWKNGKIAGYPTGSVILLVVAVIILIAGFTLPSDTATWMLLLYGWSTLCWFIVSYLTSKYYVTETGIVSELNDRSKLLEWNCILDFVERDLNDRYVTYTFFYVERTSGTDSHELKRVEVKVPANRSEFFKNIIKLKMDKGAGEKHIPEHRFELPN